MKIDLIITSYKPDKNFVKLLELMSCQTMPINRIIVVNTEQKFFDRLVYSNKFLDKYKALEIRHISKREFDCGKTRNLGVKLSDADFFIIMSQDALPMGGDLVEKLYKAFANEDVAVSYARQVPSEDATEAEKYVRRFYYPEDSAVRSLKDIETLGWSTYMCSNFCAMYRRSVFDELGGFLNHVICNEDILYASKAINAGYKVSYVSDAVVTDTKSLADKDSLKKSFDFAVSLAKHPETFDIPTMKEESHKVDRMITGHLKRNGYRGELLLYKRIAAAKKKGFAKGLKYKHLSQQTIAKYTDNHEYWIMDELLRARKNIDSHAGYGRSDAEKAMISDTPTGAKKRSEME